MLSKSQDPQPDPQVCPEVQKCNSEEEEATTELFSHDISKSSEKNVQQKIKDLQKKVLLSNKKKSSEITDSDLDVILANSETSDTNDSGSFTSSSINTAKDRPFLTKIKKHKFKPNGKILFHCTDTDEENQSWCSTDKAKVNVGAGYFSKYIKHNKLKKHIHRTKKTTSKSKEKSSASTKRILNKRKIEQEKSLKILAIINHKRCPNGIKYKVKLVDGSELWIASDGFIELYHTVLLNKYQENSKEKKLFPNENKKKYNRQ